MSQDDETFYLTGQIETEETRAEGDNTLKFSFASTTPVKRWFGYEQLDIKNADLSFADSGRAPFLLDHNSYEHENHIGVVTRAYVKGDKCYCEIRFSEREEFSGIIKDIRSGIRPNISVGYQTTERTLLAEDENGDGTYLCKFKVYEVSSVAIPADESVGLGRQKGRAEKQVDTIINDQPEVKRMDEETKVDPGTQETRSAPTPQPVQQSQMQQRVAADAVEVIELCQKWNMSERATDFLKKKLTMDEVREQVLTEVEKRNKPFDGAPAIHTKEKPKEFSYAKAFRAAATKNWNEAGFEREMCQERANNSPRSWDNNIVIIDPNESRATNTAGGVGSGKELVGTEYRNDRLIDALWNKTFLGSVGTDNMLGMVGNAVIPVINSNATTSWVTEIAALPAAQALGTAQKTVSPKEMVAKFEYSRQMLIQGVPGIEAKIIDQLYNAIAQSLDLAALSGASVALSTTGLLNEITQVVAMGTNGGAPTYKSFIDMQGLVIDSKAFMGALGYVGSAALFTKLRTTLKDSANTNSGYILPDGVNQIGGYEFMWSQNVPKNLTKGTASGVCSACVFGNWNDLVVAQWDNIAIEFDTVTAADNSKIVVRSFSFWDMLVKRTESFAVVKDFLTT